MQIEFKCPRCGSKNKSHINNLRCSVCGLTFSMDSGQVKPNIKKIFRHHNHAYVLAHYCIYKDFHIFSYQATGDESIIEDIEDSLDVFIVPYYLCTNCNRCYLQGNKDD